MIHNPSIIEELKNKGIYPANEDEIKAVCEEAESGDERETIVVIRTHGEKRDITERLLACAALNQHFHVEDCTCPYVKKIHKIRSGQHLGKHAYNYNGGSASSGGKGNLQLLRGRIRGMRYI